MGSLHGDGLFRTTTGDASGHELVEIT